MSAADAIRAREDAKKPKPKKRQRKVVASSSLTIVDGVLHVEPDTDIVVGPPPEPE